MQMDKMVLENLTEENEMLKQENQKLEVENLQLKGEIQRLNGEITSLINAYSEKLGGHTAQLDILTKDYKELEEKYNQLIKEKDLLTKDYKDLASENQELKNQIAELKAKNDSLTQKVDQLIIDVKDLQQKKDNNDANIEFFIWYQQFTLKLAKEAKKIFTEKNPGIPCPFDNYAQLTNLIPLNPRYNIFLINALKTFGLDETEWKNVKAFVDNRNLAVHPKDYDYTKRYLVPTDLTNHESLQKVVDAYHGLIVKTISLDFKTE